MITTFYPPYHFGGDAVYVYRLSNALAAEGHYVSVVHSADAYRIAAPGEPTMSFTHHPNVRLHTLGTARPALATLAAHQFGRPGPYARSLGQVIESGAFDVIHYHNISLMGGPGVMRLGQAIKLYTPHEYWLICPTHALFRLGRAACTRRTCVRCTLHARRPIQLWRYTGHMRRCLSEIDCMLMPSRFSLQQHREQGIDRPMVLHPPFVPMAEEELDAPPPHARDYFLYVGRLEKLKGVQDLIRLFTDYREADLLIVGDGAYRPVLERQAAGLDHVRFLGESPPASLGPLYRNAVALLAPSLCYETFGLTVAEALGHGAPVIVRDHGALSELVEVSGAGFAFKTLDQCLSAMRELRADPALRRTLGERGGRVARALWSQRVHLDRYLDLVEQLRSGQNQGAGSIGPNIASEPSLGVGEHAG